MDRVVFSPGDMSRRLWTACGGGWPIPCRGFVQAIEFDVKNTLYPVLVIGIIVV
jgi:hypothetical protein